MTMAEHIHKFEHVFTGRHDHFGACIYRKLCACGEEEYKWRAARRKEYGG